MGKINAEYHVSCRLLFDSTKLQRAQERSTSAAAIEERSKKIPLKVRNNTN